MIFQTNSINANGTPDDDELLAIRAALRNLKVRVRKPIEYPKRNEMMDVLEDARVRIDRINAKRQ